jgi:hypothetical protein
MPPGLNWMPAAVASAPNSPAVLILGTREFRLGRNGSIARVEVPIRDRVTHR